MLITSMAGHVYKCIAQVYCNLQVALQPGTVSGVLLAGGVGKRMQVRDMEAWPKHLSH